MAKTKLGSANESASVALRTLTGAPVTADDLTTLADASYSADSATLTAGWMSALLYAVFTGGTSPTASLRLLHRVSAVGGSGWVLAPGSYLLVPGEAVIVDVMGRDVLPVLSVVNGAPTSVAIYGAGWRAYRSDSSRVG